MWFFSFSEPLLTRLTLSLRWRTAHAFPLQTEHSLVKSRHCLAECQTNKTPKAYFNSQRALSVKLQVHKRIGEGHFTWKSSTEHLKWSSSRITSYTSRGAAGSKSCAVGKCSTKIPGRMHARCSVFIDWTFLYFSSSCLACLPRRLWHIYLFLLLCMRFRFLHETWKSQQLSS